MDWLRFITFAMSIGRAQPTNNCLEEPLGILLRPKKNDVNHFGQ